MVPFEHLGPYRIGAPIGRGGMGFVYKATHEKTGETVAVKVIAASVSDDIRFRRRFSTEIETLKKLKHPNIVTLIGHGEQHGQLFYSMELVEGESLQQRLRREKRLDWPFVLDLAIEVCNALKHAHNFGVVHRDLKPANLLITKDGTTKLVDFGIAKLFGNSDQTAIGALLGTADFMAPEQTHDGPISPRTDLYSLGNVMYACFAGRAPFAGRTMTHIIESLQRDKPVPLDLIAPNIPDQITQLVHDLLEKVPEDRPPTALAVMNRMKAIRAGLERQRLDHAVTRLSDDQTLVKESASLAESPTQVGSPLPKSLTVVADGIQQPVSNHTRHDVTIEASVAEIDPSTRNTHSDDLALTGASNRGVSLADSDVNTPSKKNHSHTGSSTPEHSKESPATHFNTIQDHDRRRSVWESDEAEHDSSRLWHALSIAAMVCVLIGATGLFLWSMRRPSADALYTMILSSQEQDDTTVMRTQIDQFRRLYPDDPRVNELKPLLQKLDSTRVMRRLRLAAVREGGDQHLPAPEQTLLEAMRDVDRDPVKTQSILRHWLDVYDPSAGGPDFEKAPELEFMVQAARQELQRLSAKPLLPGDARAEDLMSRIQWAEQNLDAEAVQKMLEGILTLYGEKSWATPVLVMARDRLNAIQTESKLE